MGKGKQPFVHKMMFDVAINSEPASRFEGLSDSVGESRGGERLLDYDFTATEIELYRRLRVSRHKHLEGRPEFPKPAGQLRAVHLRHHDVGEQEADLAGVVVGDLSKTSAPFAASSKV